MIMVVSGLLIHPSSTSGTRRGHGTAYTLASGLFSRIFFSYIPLLMVALVPMTPMRPWGERLAASSTAGVITSKTGTEKVRVTLSMAMLEAELQAMTII